MSGKKDKDYLFLSAYLRVKEASMLTADELLRMADAPDAREAARLAEEGGYEDVRMDSPATVDEDLNSRRAAIYGELEPLMPHPAALDMFRIKYDYHNAKVLVKGAGMGDSCSRMLSYAGRVGPEDLKGALEGELEVTGELGRAMREAADILARTSNPQLCDFALDKGYFKDMAETAKLLDAQLCEEYTRLLTDCANLKSLVRSRRMGKSADFLATALTEGGGVNACDVLQIREASQLEGLYMFTHLEKAAKAGAEAMEGGSVAGFELECDNALSECLGKAALKAFGPEVCTAYLAALDTEIMNLRIILSGKVCNIPPEVIKERLRYGSI